MKRHKFSIPAPISPAQEQELLMWEMKLASYGNNIDVNRLLDKKHIDYEVDIEEEELNMDEFHKFTKSLYRRE